MHGNVWEWCEDKWHGNYQGSPSDGRARVDGRGDLRVMRGGSWFNYASYTRAASRSFNSSGYRSDGSGFRVARTVP